MVSIWKYQQLSHVPSPIHPEGGWSLCSMGDSWDGSSCSVFILTHTLTSDFKELREAFSRPPQIWYNQGADRGNQGADGEQGVGALPSTTGVAPLPARSSPSCPSRLLLPCLLGPHRVHTGLYCPWGGCRSKVIKGQTAPPQSYKKINIKSTVAFGERLFVHHKRAAWQYQKKGVGVLVAGKSGHPHPTPRSCPQWRLLAAALLPEGRLGRTAPGSLLCFSKLPTRASPDCPLTSLCPLWTSVSPVISASPWTCEPPLTFPFPHQHPILTNAEQQICKVPEDTCEGHIAGRPQTRAGRRTWRLRGDWSFCIFTNSHKAKPAVLKFQRTKESTGKCRWEGHGLG